MSQYPPSQPGIDSTLPYGGQPRTSALALTAMILGIVSIPLVCALGLGFLTGIVAIILGALALRAINKDPFQYGGKGMAMTGLITGIVAAVLAPLIFVIFLAGNMAVLGPSLGKSRELANRSLCAANLRGIVQSMVVYASDNNDCFPYLGPGIVTPQGRGVPSIVRVAAQPPLGDTPGGLMHDMFYLVGAGAVAPKQFICKSDPAKLTPTMTPPSSPAAPGYAPTYWNAPGSNPDLTYSYSFAFQYSKPDELGAWWKNTMDAGLPLAADMNPGNQNAKPTKNSLTHQGDGQNIAFADGHVEFSRTPCAGENGDHIYNTAIVNNLAAPGTTGLPPFTTPAGNTMGTFDTCLVPGLNDVTAYTRK